MQISWTLVQGNGEGRLEDFLTACLSPRELGRFRQFRFAKRREEWLLGRWTAKKLLVASQPDFADLPPQSIEVMNESDGSPYLLIHGERYGGCLSISHRDGWAFCAITRESRLSIGVDLEKVEPREPSFVADYFTSAEQDWVANTQASEQEMVIATIWSAKESVMKVLRQGLRIDTWEIEISPGQDRQDWGRFPSWNMVRARSSHLPPGDHPLYLSRRGEFVLTLMSLPAVPLEDFCYHPISM